MGRRRSFGYPPGTRGNYRRGASIAGSFLKVGAKVATGSGRRRRSTWNSSSSQNSGCMLLLLLVLSPLLALILL